MANLRPNTARLSHHLCSVLVLLGIACGGTTENAPHASGGSSAGGASGNGHSSGGAAAGGAVGDTAGVRNGGSSSGGVGGYKSNTGGSFGQAGDITITVAGSSSGVGGATVDERCPERLPSGAACTADDAGATCEYDVADGCLCYMNPSQAFLPCQKVDPTCTYGGAGGQAPAPGAGGSSAKIALPPRQVCSCAGSTWTCTYGI